MFSLVFSRRFAMAHRLLADASAKCAIPHGHNEVVTVRLVATRPLPLDGRANMVESFESAKRDWHAWVDNSLDHSLHLAASDPLLEWFRTQEPQRLPRILLTPGDPTTEALACCLMSKCNAFLSADGGRLRCAEISIEETPTNTVRFDGDPEAWLPVGGDRWWRRADASVNDL
jgi:6-pyruvoyltetrahydropterin/6-carboxytetrahydropterin synthase